MNGRVRCLAEHYQRRVAAAAVEGVRARYDFGEVLHLLRYGTEPGTDAAELPELAALLSVHMSALHRQARVTEVIRSDEFEHLLRTRSDHGAPITWSHLEKLATIRSRARRDEVVRLLAGTSLDIRQLARLLRAKSPA